MIGCMRVIIVSSWQTEVALIWYSNPVHAYQESASQVAYTALKVPAVSLKLYHPYFSPPHNCTCIIIIIFIIIIIIIIIIWSTITTVKRVE
jgi:hypothetical protein